MNYHIIHTDFEFFLISRGPGWPVLAEIFEVICNRHLWRNYRSVLKDVTISQDETIQSGFHMLIGARWYIMYWTDRTIRQKITSIPWHLPISNDIIGLLLYIFEYQYAISYCFCISHSPRVFSNICTRIIIWRKKS